MTEKGNEYRTVDHRIIMNEAGIAIVEASAEEEDVRGRPVQQLQPHEALAYLDFVAAHRVELKALQEQLDQTWLAVADEVIDHFEMRAAGSAVEATGEEIMSALDELSALDTPGMWAPCQTPAALWYRQLWVGQREALIGVGAEHYGERFERQWVPFLRVLARRRRERFPDLASPEPVRPDARTVFYHEL